MMGVLLEDMPFVDLSLIERVGLETEGLGCNIEEVCKPWFLDSWKLHERSEFEVHSLKDVQGSLGVDKVCARPSHAKQIQLTTSSLHLQDMLSSDNRKSMNDSSQLDRRYGT